MALKRSAVRTRYPPPPSDKKSAPSTAASIERLKRLFLAFGKAMKMPKNVTTPEQQPARTLAAIVPDARQDISVIPILAAREEVLARFGAVFQPGNLAALELGRYRDFLKFENNKHWAGLDRRAYAVKDIGLLRENLADLVDEGAPVAERIDRVVGRTPGMSVAVATAILHVVYPEKYAPWSRTSTRALARLKLRPKFTRDATEGEKYAAINAVVVRLAGELGLHLWDLDAVFQYLVAGADGGGGAGRGWAAAAACRYAVRSASLTEALHVSDIQRRDAQARPSGHAGRAEVSARVRQPTAVSELSL